MGPRFYLLPGARQWTLQNVLLNLPNKKRRPNGSLGLLGTDGRTGVQHHSDMFHYADLRVAITIGLAVTSI